MLKKHTLNFNQSIYMKKYIVAFALLVLPLVSQAAILPSLDNGSPEMVVSPWGYTNSQLPHLKPGEKDCPAFISTYCVDVKVTEFWKVRWGK